MNSTDALTTRAIPVTINGTFREIAPGRWASETRPVEMPVIPGIPSQAKNGSWYIELPMSAADVTEDGLLIGVQDPGVHRSIGEALDAGLDEAEAHLASTTPWTIAGRGRSYARNGQNMQRLYITAASLAS